MPRPIKEGALSQSGKVAHKANVTRPFGAKASRRKAHRPPMRPRAPPPPPRGRAARACRGQRPHAHLRPPTPCSPPPADPMLTSTRRPHAHLRPPTPAGAAAVRLIRPHPPSPTRPGAPPRPAPLVQPPPPRLPPTTGALRLAARPGTAAAPRVLNTSRRRRRATRAGARKGQARVLGVHVRTPLTPSAPLAAVPAPLRSLTREVCRCALRGLPCTADTCECLKVPPRPRRALVQALDV
jgi:hypothetical protein